MCHDCLFQQLHGISGTVYISLRILPLLLSHMFPVLTGSSGYSLQSTRYERFHMLLRWAEDSLSVNIVSARFLLLEQPRQSLFDHPTFQSPICCVWRQLLEGATNCGPGCTELILSIVPESRILTGQKKQKGMLQLINKSFGNWLIMLLSQTERY
jgi:hypothetical protein